MGQTILITGASSGFGKLAAEALAKAGHTVFANLREATGRNAPVVAEYAKKARQDKLDLRTVELDMSSETSAKAAAAEIVKETSRVDVVVHNAGHMTSGPLIVMPRAFAKGTNHFAQANAPDGKKTNAVYEKAPFGSFADQVKKASASIVPEDAEVSKVAEVMVDIVNAPRGKHPFRVGVDFTDDGSMAVNPMLDHARAEILHRVGLGDLLPAKL